MRRRSANTLACCCLFIATGHGAVLEPPQILIRPLMSTHWSQWAPYNQMCPLVTNGLTGYGGRSPTGCVPVAIGQIMRYYGWPQAGAGVSAYSDTNGICQGDFTVAWTNAIPWAFLKDYYDPWYDDCPDLVLPLADLMLKLGVAGETDFEPNGGSADIMVAARALVQHLDYVMGDLIKANDPLFAQTIEQELNAHRPVLLNLNIVPPHTVVADGLAQDGLVKYVHLNYGWGGQNDGWYAGYDSGSTQSFTAILSTLRPKPDVLITCAPNFFELTTTNGIVPDLNLEVIGVGNKSNSYSMTASASWVSVTPSTGVTGTNPLPHRIHLEPASFPSGTNNAVITIAGDTTNRWRQVLIRVYKPEPPIIIQQPADIITLFPTGQVLTISAQAGKVYAPYISNDTLRYQWLYHGQPMDAATNSWCYTTDYGSYQCQVTSLGGTIPSREAVVGKVSAGSRIKIIQFSPSQIILEVGNVQSGQFVLQTGFDLKNWTDLNTVKVTLGGTVQLKINIPAGDTQRFFQMRE